MPEKPESPFGPEHFRRDDERPDAVFYAEPRLVVHIDQFAIEAIREYLLGVLPSGGVILDLMSSWRSHLPEGQPRGKVVGLGLNAVEMRENPQVDDALVHDLNANPTLPFRDDSLDAAILTVSVQYMTKPEQVFWGGGPGAEARGPVPCDLLESDVPDKGVGDMEGAFGRRPGSASGGVFPSVGRVGGA